MKLNLYELNNLNTHKFYIGKGQKYRALLLFIIKYKNLIWQFWKEKNSPKTRMRESFVILKSTQNQNVLVLHCLILSIVELRKISPRIDASLL